MKKRFYSDILKKRFNVAWDCIPRTIQIELRSFIRYIDEAPKLEGTFIYAHTGLRGGIKIIEGPLKDGGGFTFFFSANKREFCDVILPTDPLISASDGIALATILHELSHSYEYFLHRKKEGEVNKHKSEVYAWTKAIQWSEESLLGIDLIKDIQHYAKLAISYETHKAG